MPFINSQNDARNNSVIPPTGLGDIQTVSDNENIPNGIFIRGTVAVWVAYNDESNRNKIE